MREENNYQGEFPISVTDFGDGGVISDAEDGVVTGGVGFCSIHLSGKEGQNGKKSYSIKMRNLFFSFVWILNLVVREREIEIVSER